MTSRAIERRSTACLCRFCGSPLTATFVDLGLSPLANAYVDPEGWNGAETFYPLRAFVCEGCFLVQLEQYEAPERIFGDYLYFSSYSSSWIDHTRQYADGVIRRFGIGPSSLAVEIASNDGCLLHHFRERGVRVLGVEPAANVARVAEAGGIPTVVDFFGTRAAKALAAEGMRADLLVGNNVLAHVPDLNDFVAGMKILLRTDGIFTVEFPHLLRLIEGNQFDTIYHEHFSYFSFLTAERVFSRHGLTLFDVEELSTHGGSLRIYGCHAENRDRAVGARVGTLRGREKDYGLDDLACYSRFQEKVYGTKRNLLSFLIGAKQAGKSIVGYGAPAKGNTLLNYCGIRTDFLDYTVDRSPHKQNRLLPGTRIPIVSPERIRETKPDYVLILPWNLHEEIMEQVSYVRSWGGRFVVPIPEVKVLD